MLLTTLKDELFAVETDRLEGRLNEAEYSEQKAAIEVVLKRALARKNHGFAACTGSSHEGLTYEYLQVDALCWSFLLSS